MELEELCALPPLRPVSPLHWRSSLWSDWDASSAMAEDHVPRPSSSQYSTLRPGSHRRVSHGSLSDLVSNGSNRRLSMIGGRIDEVKDEVATTTLLMHEETDGSVSFPQSSSIHSTRGPHVKDWKWELLCWVVSSLIFVAIALILATFNDRPPPSWYYGITLNALISLLGTLGVSMLMGAIAAAMGQLRWNHYRGAAVKRLEDFEMIDRASRGPAGSLRFIVTRCNSFWVVVGATITILVLAVNPFVQQIITYDNTPTVTGDATASLSLATCYYPISPVPLESTFAVSTVNLAAKAAIYSGLFGSGNDTFTPPSTCTTGNCTWSNHDSLAVCASCVNITDHLNSTYSSKQPNTTNGTTYQQPTTVWTLPNGLKLIQYTMLGIHSVQNRMIISNTFEGYPSVAFPGFGSVFLDTFVITAGQAAECLLQYCIRTMSATEVNGVYIENVTATWTNNSAYTDSLDWKGTDVSEGYYDSDYATLANGNYALYLTPPNSNTTFVVESKENALQSKFLSKTFEGNVSIMVVELGEIIYSTDVAQAVFQNVYQGSFDTFFERMDHVAASMSQYLRTSSINSGTIQVPGVASRTETRIHVRWLWITMPFVLELFGLGFLLAVMIETRRLKHGVWKTGTLPVLFHTIDAETRIKLGLLRDCEAMTEAGQSLRVRFDAAEGDGHFVSIPNDDLG